MQDSIDVVVVGRVNIDLTVRVPFRPTSGQTAVASAMTATPGGKSLNQAMTAAGLGGRIALVAHAGDDVWGRQLAAALAEAGVDTSCFRLLAGAATGAAIVEVAPDGETSIVLAVSADTELVSEDIEQALTRFAAPVVVQLDLPPAALTAVATLPRPRPVIGNLVPSPGVDARLLQRLDMIVVNQQEAAAILDKPSVDPVVAAQELRRLGPAAAVVTAGAAGAAYSYVGGSDMIAAAHVAVVDTAGAGDAFLGSLALDLSRGAALAPAVARAVRVGSDAVQHHGANPAGWVRRA